MRRMLAILALLMAPGAALAQGTAACERVFRQCIADCAGPPGACTAACHGERAICIQNPSRPPQPARAAR